MIRRLSLAVALVTLAALGTSRLDAQLGTTKLGDGFRIQVRHVGGPWEKELATGWDSLAAGTEGSGKPIDGLSVRHAVLAVRLQVATKDGWLPLGADGERTGVEGSPITGVRLTCQDRSIRYRGTFVGAGERKWVIDGEPLEAGGAPLESLLVEIVDAAPKNAAPFEYRVFFAGSGFTPWMKQGQVAEGKGEKPFATAIQMRGGKDLRYEIALHGGSLGATALAGEVAGDESGKRPLGAIRIFNAVPIRYRVRIEGTGWGPWMSDGQTAGAGGHSLRIEAIAVELKH